jgi:hypothetical protein
MEYFKNLLEIIYYLSGPALVIIACIALNQITLTKNQIEEQKKATRITAKRDAMRLTSDQIKEYGLTIIPIINILDKKIEEKEIQFFKKSKVIIREDGIKVKPYSDDKEIEKLKDLMNEFLNVTNALEGFSSFFISGCADEKLAYKSLSTTFCNSVKNILPLIVMLSSNRHAFSATLELFTIWNNRLESEELYYQKKELEEKLKSKKEKTIKTIGSE